MNPSSTSNSEPATTPPHKVLSFSTLRVSLRPAIKLIIAMAMLFLILEGAVRVWQPFPTYGGWENPDLYKKMEGARQTFEQEGRIDVLLLSTSIGRPIDVNLWEDASGNQLVCYNGGYPDARPQSQRFLFEHYYWPRFRPTHVVYCVTPGDLSSSARGMHPDRPRAEPFWRYHNIREMDPGGLKDKIKIWLENLSMLVQSRHRIRARLETGPLPVEDVTPSIGRGVLVPAIGRVPTGPQLEPWSRKPQWWWANPYKDYWLPDNGEMGELKKLAEFCRARNVKLTIVDIPISPFALMEFDDEELGMDIYYNALARIEASGVPVVYPGAELDLDNSYFEDSAHMNRWGAEIVTDYIWQHVIRKWFPQKALVKSIPMSTEIKLYRNVKPAPGVRTEQRIATVPGAMYSALYQVIVENTATAIPLDEVGPGRYSVEVYGGDGSTMSPVMNDTARVTLQGSNEQGILTELALDEWALSRLGPSYTRGLITVETTATLQLHVEAPPAAPLILDVAFLREMVSAGPDKVTVEEGLPDDR